MKKILLFCAFSPLNSLFCQAEINFDLKLACNFSTQVYTEPGTQNGKQQWETLQTIGAGFLCTKNFGKNSFSARLMYQQKGFNAIVDYISIGTSIDQTTLYLQNRLDYLTVDLIYRRLFGKKKIQPFFYSGIQGGQLIKERLEIVALNAFEFENNYRNPQKRSFGLIAGVGIRLNDKAAIEFETVTDLSFSIKNEVVHSRNWTWSIGLALNISKLMAKSN